MDFFDSIPEPPEPDWPEDDDELQPSPPWLGAPEDVVGVPVPDVRILHRDEHVVVALAELTAFPTGVRIELRLSVRRRDWPRERWYELQEAFWEEAPVGPRRGGRQIGVLRVGVELSDGRRASTTAPYERGIDPERPPEPPVLVEGMDGGGGTGSTRSLDSSRRVWLWPLPDGDTFDLVVDWPGLDVPLSRHTVDARAVRSAAEKALRIWP